MKEVRWDGCELGDMSAPDIMDWPHDSRQTLSSRRGLFKGLRTDAAEVTVAPGPVIEDFNVIEDIGLGQIPGFVYSLSERLYSEQGVNEKDLLG
ncbi:Uncharacterised protein [Serratia rubidaea]|uniref:Uncharacterized protein n=1 Tax=Serratia rubidaea TaxID=61652 RepID=A0A447QRG9_SERRU|nr:Uncharacterised protein [Serratia rubidaea]